MHHYLNFTTMLSTFTHLTALALLISGSQEAPVTGDGVCDNIRTVLCVRDVLLHIASLTKSINRTLNELETSIASKIETKDTVNYYINFETQFIHAQLPKPEFHTQFHHLNNIVQVRAASRSAICFYSLSFSIQNHLTQLLLEAHYAISFYYNTINVVMKMPNYIVGSTDVWLKQIQSNLRNDIICQYRSILNVYSYDWPSIGEVGHIRFSQGKYHDAPSLEHEIRAIVIARLLREWMRRINLVITGVHSKFV